MGDDSCLRGHGFGSQRRILDGHFFTLICCKICIVCLKGPKINEKKTGVGPFFKKTSLVPTFKMLQQRTESFCQFLAAKKLKKLSYGLTVKMILTLESFPNFRHLFFDVFWHPHWHQRCSISGQRDLATFISDVFWDDLLVRKFTWLVQ